MATWPLALPRLPLRDGQSLSPQPNVVAFGAEVGPPKTRRRSTARTEAITATVKLTRDQLARFKDFFNDELADGSLAFDWIDFDTCEATSYKFDPSRLYSVTPLGPKRLVAMSLIRLS